MLDPGHEDGGGCGAGRGQWSDKSEARDRGEKQTEAGAAEEQNCDEHL